jgi:hypothetical protein
VLWVLGDQLQIPAVTAAMLGLCSLLLTGVLKWKDCLEYSQARPTSTFLLHLTLMHLGHAATLLASAQQCACFEGLPEIYTACTRTCSALVLSPEHSLDFGALPACHP